MNEEKIKLIDKKPKGVKLVSNKKTCLSCGAGNELFDKYCRVCGSKLNYLEQKDLHQSGIGVNSNEIREENKKKLKTLAYVFVVYYLIDIVAIAIFYGLYMQEIIKIPVINNNIDTTSAAFKKIQDALALMALGISILQLLLFKDGIIKLKNKNTLAEYYLGYITIPAIQCALLLLFTVMTAKIDVRLNYVEWYVIAAGILVGIIHVPYRMLEVGYEKIKNWKNLMK